MLFVFDSFALLRYNSSAKVVIFGQFSVCFGNKICIKCKKCAIKGIKLHKNQQKCSCLLLNAHLSPLTVNH